MCIHCGQLIKAIDAYIAKADDDLAATLGDEGYMEPQKTVDAISKLEELVAEALLSETDYIIKAVKKADSLLSFQMDIWPKLKEEDTLQADLQAIFLEQLGEIVRMFADFYFSAIENGDGKSQVTKASINIVRVSKQTTAWVENWSQELADIMKLNSHKEIESILSKGLEDGIGIQEFARNIMNSGIRDEWYKARRVAVTEVLTAHRAGQQEAYLQSPSTSMKMWRHTGIYINGPRQNHKDMDGRKVPKDQPFELLGADGHFYHPMFPGDTLLPPGERIECHCTTQGIVDEKVLGLPLEERKRLQQEAIDELDEKWFQEQEERNKALAGFGDDLTADGVNDKIEIKAEPLKIENFPPALRSKREIKNTQTFIDYINGLEHADPHVVALYNRLGKLEGLEQTGCPLKISHASNHSCGFLYDARKNPKVQITLTIPKLTGDNYAGQVNTTLHEEMHLMDLFCRPNTIIPGNVDWFSDSSTSLMQVIQNTPGTIGDKVKALFTSFHAEYDKITDMYMQECELKEKELYANYCMDKYGKEPFELDLTEYAQYKEGLYREVKRLEAERDAQIDYHSRNAMGGGIDLLEDIYDALSGGEARVSHEVYYGHGKDYYNDIRRRASEILANYGALGVTRLDLIAMLEEDKPELVQELKIIIQEMLKKAGV